MANRRLARLNEQLRREITGILLQGVNDPRVKSVSVTDVAVTPDLWVARVYVRLSGGERERREAMEGLRAASGFIRRTLGSTLHVRRVPELRFFEDQTLDRVARIEEILSEIGQEQRRRAADGDGEEEASDD